jgi:hypothetical protein
MATTTNYSWTTPDDTALVKDGAAAIRSLGTAIDTTVFNNAGAAIAKTIVDAKGDLIAATAADTVARLGVGTNGQLLAANSSTATGLEWQTVSSGGMTLLSTTALSGTTTTVSSISGSYNDLIILVQGAVWGTASAKLRIIPNTNLTGWLVRAQDYQGTAALDTSSYMETITDLKHTGGENVLYGRIFNYANTTNRKACQWTFGGPSGASSINTGTGGGVLLTNSAITSIGITTDGGYTFSAGEVLIYGVK